MAMTKGGIVSPMMLLALALLPIAPGSGLAQTNSQSNGAVESDGPVPGQAGQRQTREQVAPSIRPLARIANRINGRVDNRLETRMSRNSDVRNGASSAIEAADARTRSASHR